MTKDYEEYILEQARERLLDDYSEDAEVCAECGGTGTVVVRASGSRRITCPVCGGAE